MDDRNINPVKDEHVKDGHVYDGIEEEDNPLPSWWLWSFLLTVIFAFLYYTHYEISKAGPSLQDEFTQAMDELEKHKASAPRPTETEESLLAAMGAESLLSLGQTTFDGKCAACHGNQLQGVIGPNLTDNYWLHGKGSRLDILTVVRTGIPEKGMPPWESMLSRDEQYGVVAYILSKHGSNPAGAKAPEGTEIK